VTTGRIIELAVAVVLLVAGVVLYRRRDKSDSYGSQGAVILIVVSTIIAIHALRLMEYHPSKAEADMIMQRSKG
jgi:hypothetical protein